MISLAIMAVLLGATMSAIMVSTQALPGRSVADEQCIALGSAMTTLERDLRSATSIISASANQIEFTVADRGHGSAGPETIIYSWSGVAGEALKRSYNGVAANMCVSNIAEFTLAMTTTPGELKQAPRVLLVAASAAPTSTSDDGIKRDLLRSWGFSVQVVADNVSLATFQAAALNTDVIYVSEDIDPSRASGLWYNTTRGVVIEESSAIAAYGFVLLPLNSNGYRVRIANVSLPIVFGFVNNEQVDVTSSSYSLNRQNALLLAPGTTVLGSIGTDATLIAMDAGGTMISGQPSAGRRVVMPWGENTVLLLVPTDFPFSAVTATGKRILRQALTWAATPQAVSEVTVRLRVRDAGAVTVESRVTIPNRPRDPRP
ncbi:MAG: hypothetical protein JNG88_01955 [Phycisphaerales bacterium]|nr:hypothetical protein [Phycisphaerales bacterium]